MRNMTRKHMIHQRIKYQGIPVVSNVDTYDPLTHIRSPDSFQPLFGSTLSNTQSQLTMDSMIIKMQRDQQQQIHPPRPKLTEIPSYHQPQSSLATMPHNRLLDEGRKNYSSMLNKGEQSYKTPTNNEGLQVTPFNH